MNLTEKQQLAANYMNAITTNGWLEQDELLDRLAKKLRTEPEVIKVEGLDDYRCRKLIDATKKVMVELMIPLLQKQVLVGFGADEKAGTLRTIINNIRYVVDIKGVPYEVFFTDLAPMPPKAVFEQRPFDWLKE